MINVHITCDACGESVELPHAESRRPIRIPDDWRDCLAVRVGDPINFGERRATEADVRSEKHACGRCIAQCPVGQHLATPFAPNP